MSEEILSSGATDNSWQVFITPFATAIGKTNDEVTNALKALVGEPGGEAIELLKSETNCPAAEIQEVFLDVPKAKLRKAIGDLRKAGAPAAEAQTGSVLGNPSFDVLPSAPDDASWLNLLKAGGVLKVASGVVVSGIRAALASRTGLFEIPALLIEKMEAQAESLEEPVGGSFYELRNQLTKKNYAEVFAALGINGTYATQGRKEALLSKLNENLWPSLKGFQEQLKGWVDSWQRNFSNPGMLVPMLASLTGGGGAAMPTGMMQPPETDTLRDAAEGVVAIINRSFAGTGIPVASALAWDAKNITEVLENPSLPMQIGAANREQMLKTLGVAVTADYVRLERNLTRFALGIMELDKIPGGQSELTYISALAMLGDQIPWDKLTTMPRRNLPRATKVRGDE